MLSDKQIRKEIINRYLGVPYIHKGRTLAGLDCWGFIIDVYKHFKNIDIFDLENYDKDWFKKGKNHFAENYYQKWIKKMKPSFLDVILFKTSKGCINHAGLFLGSGQFIHCPEAGVGISRLNDKWKERIEGFYTYDNS